MTLNKMMVIGNVGGDPEMRYTPNGTPVTSFTVATNRRYTTADGEQHEETEWFRISAWNRLAETCNQYITKGMKVYVEGRLQSRPWIGNDGQPRAGNEISAFEVKFLSRPGAGPDEGRPGAVPDQKEAPTTATGGGAVPDQKEVPTTATGGAEDIEDLPW